MDNKRKRKREESGEEGKLETISEMSIPSPMILRPEEEREFLGNDRKKLGSREIEWNYCVKQNTFKGQDYVMNGEGSYKGHNFTFHVVFDGHGDDKCIQFIRKISKEDMSKMMETDNPVQTIAEYITNKGNVKTGEGGSTMNMIRFYEDHIESFNCGDSEAIFFINDNEIYRTVKHDYKNIDERKRVSGKNGQFARDKDKNILYRIKDYELFNDVSDTDKGLNAYFMTSHRTCVVDKTHIKGIYSERTMFIDPKTNSVKAYLTPTQALGHGSTTGYSNSKHTINFKTTDRVKVIIASDGLWDMVVEEYELDRNEDKKFLLKNNSMEILKKSDSRWRQVWKNMKEGEQKPYTGDQIDDISVIVVESGSCELDEKSKKDSGIMRKNKRKSKRKSKSKKRSKKRSKRKSKSKLL